MQKEITSEEDKYSDQNLNDANSENTISDPTNDIYGSTTATDGGWGWVVVFGSFIIHAIIDGIAFSFGVFLPEFVTYFELGRAEVSFLGSLTTGTACLSGPISSALVNKYGCRKVTIAGSILAAFGFFISIFANNIVFLYCSIGIVTGLGFGLLYIPIIVSVGLYFKRRTALAIGIAACGAGVGAFIMAPLCTLLIQEYGWKGATLILAGILLNCAVAGAVFRPILPTVTMVTENKEKVVEIQEIDTNDTHTAEDASPKTVATGIDGYPKIDTKLHIKSNNSLYIYVSSMTSMLNTKTMSHNKMNDSKNNYRRMIDCSVLKNPLFLLVVLSTILRCISYTTPLAFLPDHAMQAGTEYSMASFLLSVFGIGNTFGRVIFGLVADFECVNRLHLFNSILTVAGTTTALIGFFNNYVLLVIYACLYGILLGASVVMFYVVLVELFGIDKLSTSYAVQLLFQGVAMLVGTPLFGWVFDRSGSYKVSFGIAGAMLALSGLMLFLIPCLQHKKVSLGSIEHKKTSQ